MDKTHPGAQKRMLSPLAWPRWGERGPVILDSLPSSFLSHAKVLSSYPPPSSPQRSGQSEHNRFPQSGGVEDELSWAVGLAVAREERPLLVLQVRMVRGELVDESGGSPLEWIGLIRAARNPQEQTLEAIADLPGGQVLWASHCQVYLPDRHQS